MNRRTFLRRGIFGGLLLAVGSSVGLGLWPTKRSAHPHRPLHVMNERQFAILAAVAARIVQVPKADPVELAHRVDERLALAYPEVRTDFAQLLLLLDNAFTGLILDGRPRPFTRLSAVEQDAALAQWRDSRLLLRRGGYSVLRKLTQAAYYASPDCWEEVGYPGPPQLVVPT